MSETRYGVHDCPNGFYYLRDVTDHSVYIHRNYGYLYSPYKEDIELVSTLLNELADKVDEQQSEIDELEKNFDDIVKWASEIAKRNVILDEKIGKLQRENKKLKEEEKLYAQEILRLNTLLKQYQANQDLGGGY